MKHAAAKSAEISATLVSRETLHSSKPLSLVLASARGDTLSTFAGERARLASAIYQSRRDRDRHFDAELFADPAWDILLILYCANHAQQRLSMTSVCISAAVPATTALRWIRLLCRLQFVGKAKSPTDARVTWLFILDEARQRLDRYLDRMMDKPALAQPPVRGV